MVYAQPRPETHSRSPSSEALSSQETQQKLRAQTLKHRQHIPANPSPKLQRAHKEHRGEDGEGVKMA